MSLAKAGIDPASAVAASATTAPKLVLGPVVRWSLDGPATGSRKADISPKSCNATGVVPG